MAQVLYDAWQVPRVSEQTIPNIKVGMPHAAQLGAMRGSA